MVWDEEDSCLQIYGQFSEGTEAYIIGSPIAFEELLVSIDEVLEQNVAVQHTSTSDGEGYELKLGLIAENDYQQIEDHYYRQFGRKNQQSYSYPEINFPQSPYPPEEIIDMIERKNE